LGILRSLRDGSLKIDFPSEPLVIATKPAIHKIEKDYSAVTLQLFNHWQKKPCMISLSCLEPLYTSRIRFFEGKPPIKDEEYQVLQPTSMRKNVCFHKESKSS
jgi:hypothetical protein